MGTLDLLPATAEEVAAVLGITLKQAHGRLAYYKNAGKAKRTDRRVPLRAPGKRGRRVSRLWVRV